KRPEIRAEAMGLRAFEKHLPEARPLFVAHLRRTPQPPEQSQARGALAFPGLVPPADGGLSHVQPASDLGLTYSLLEQRRSTVAPGLELSDAAGGSRCGAHAHTDRTCRPDALRS